MAISILERPLKSIYDTNGDFLFKSKFNASGGDLPTNYKIGSDLFPISEGTEYEDLDPLNINGRLQIEVDPSDYTAIDSDSRYEVNAWITIRNNFSGQDTYHTGQIVSFDAGDDTILTTIPYDLLFDSGTNYITFYPKDYAIWVNVYAFNADSIVSNPTGFIAQKKVTSFVYNSDYATNVTDCNIGGLVKSVISSEYSELTNTTENTKQHCFFYIEYAEVYKRVNSDGENELWSSSEFQSEWTNKQPTFVIDFFNCNSPDLSNQEFTSDLTDWTNTAAIGNNDFVWDTGAAETDLGTVGTDKASQYLSQDYTYTESARYGIDVSVSGDYPFTFYVYKENISTNLRELIHREVIDISATVSFSFSASYVGRGEDFDRISFRVFNNSTSNNTVRVEYFRQTQAGFACLPILQSVYGVRQFGNPTAGSMGDLEGSYEHVGKLLTTYTNKILTPNDIQPELSFLLNSDMAESRFGAVQANVTYTDGTENTYFSGNTETGVYGLKRALLTPIIEGIQQDVGSGLVVSTIDLFANSTINNLLAEYTEGTFEDNTGTFDVDGATTTVVISTDDPYEGTYSAKIDLTTGGTGIRQGGFYNDIAISLVGGEEYIFSAYLKYDQATWVTNSGSINSTYVLFGVFDSTKSTALVTYKEYLNLDEYKKITLSYTPSIDEDVYIRVGKNLGQFGSGTSNGARIIYVDNIKVEGPATTITDILPATYKESSSCYTASIKWLNDLGGWDNYTFDTAKNYTTDILENTRYSSDVMGNWDSGFTSTTGSEFEQSIKYREVITLSTKIVNIDLKKTLSTIKTSIHVLMYNEDLQKYITVLVDKDSFSVYNEGQNTYKFSFDISLPLNYVQNS